MSGNPEQQQTDQQQQQIDQQQLRLRVEQLRVADQELSSGNTRGEVYVRLSPGSVAFLTDRPVAQARVSRQLRQAVDSDPFAAAADQIMQQQQRT